MAFGSPSFVKEGVGGWCFSKGLHRIQFREKPPGSMNRKTNSYLAFRCIRDKLRIYHYLHGNIADKFADYIFV